MAVKPQVAAIFEPQYKLRAALQAIKRNGRYATRAAAKRALDMAKTNVPPHPKTAARANARAPDAAEKTISPPPPPSPDEIEAILLILGAVSLEALEEMSEWVVAMKAKIRMLEVDITMLPPSATMPAPELATAAAR
jgi:hypothetical protein